jgi:hypothetical protein
MTSPVRKTAKEVAQIRSDSTEHACGRFYFDNETPATQCREISGKMNAPWGYPHAWLGSMSRVTEWKDTEFLRQFADDQIVLRYNYGRYYTVSRLSDGGYLFNLLNEQGRLVDSCVIQKLIPVKEFSSLSLEWENMSLLDPNPVILDDVEPSSETVACRLDNLTTVVLEYRDKQLQLSMVAAPEDSVLTYLLPQDLALIS